MRALSVLAVVALASIAAGGVAYADHAPDFGPRWSDLTPAYAFTPSVPSGDWRSRITDGKNQWNNVGTSLQYTGPVADQPNRDPQSSCGPVDTVTLHRFNIDGGGGVLGLSGYCIYTNTNTRATGWIIFDSSEEWCLGTGDCYDGFLGLGVGANIDLWSVASHEWGHVSTLTHYTASDAVCEDNGGQATLCPTYKPGTERQRTLETHDRASLDRRY